MAAVVVPMAPADRAAAEPSSPPQMAQQAWRMPPKADLEQAITFLQEDASSADRCVSCCAMLESATMRSAACHSGVLRAGAPRGFVRAMKEHLQNIEVQTLSLRAMQHLAAAVNLDGAKHISDAGGCAAAVAAMNAHPGHALVQQAACHALELIAFGGPEPRTRAVADGAVETTVRAMKAHKENSDIQHAALSTLQALVEESSDAAKRFSDASGPAALVSSLVMHKKDAQVQYWASLLVRTLSEWSTDVRVDIQRKCHYQGIELDLEE